jgi:hypothetical protein
MIVAGVWADRKQRRKRIHQPRRRRECVGELGRSMAASTGGRGPRSTMHAAVFIDDATSRLMHLQFVENESTFSYFHATRAYLEA